MNVAFGKRALEACAAVALLASACVVEPPLEPAAVRVEARTKGVAGPTPPPVPARLRFVYEQYPGAPGLLVKAVETGRSADRAGVRRGDCIMAIGGRPLAPDADLEAFFRPFAVGQRVQLDLVRDGRPLTLEAVLDPAAPVDWRAPGLPTLVFTTSPVCMKALR